MPLPRYADHDSHLAAVRRAALQAADAGAAVRRNLRLQDSVLHVGAKQIALTPDARLYVIAFGKASPAMVEAAMTCIAPRLHAGVAAVPRHHPVLPAPIASIPAGHPLPDRGSLRAGAAAAELLRTVRAQDVVLVLISGGGSAMFELPLDGIRLEDLRAVNQLLLLSGAPIEELNQVRRALSRVKAGGLARLAAPAQVAALILSDVVGDRLTAIASGPTVLRAVPAARARAMMQRYGLWEKAPGAVRQALGREPVRRPRAHRPVNVLVGTNRDVVQAAARQARRLGFPTRIISQHMRGEARRVGWRLAQALSRAPRPACLLMGGETTVTVQGQGRGGRNQELALAAALHLADVPAFAIMALATDGIDGPTDAAGAVVDAGTLSQALARGLDPQAALSVNDTYPLLDALGALIRTGPTGTNLNDLLVGLSYPA